MPKRVIYTGERGTFWTNNTGRALYQFIAALDHTFNTTRRSGLRGAYPFCAVAGLSKS
jgi:hypothetical protein